MVFRKRVSKRKINKRKGHRPGKRSTVNVNRALTPFAQRYITTMKYCDVFNLNTTGITAVGTYAYRLNSLFDPDFSGVGHQPMGRDTLETLYNRYRVFKVDYVITGASANAYTVKIGALPANDTVPATNFSEIQEKPRSKFVIQNPGGSQAILKGSVSLPSLYGRTAAQVMSDDRYQADMGSNPAEAAILNIYGSLIGDAAVVNSIACMITLTYHVECFDPKVLAQS